MGPRARSLPNSFTQPQHSPAAGRPPGANRTCWQVKARSWSVEPSILLGPPESCSDPAPQNHLHWPTLVTLMPRWTRHPGQQPWPCEGTEGRQHMVPQGDTRGLGRHMPRPPGRPAEPGARSPGSTLGLSTWLLCSPRPHHVAPVQPSASSWASVATCYHIPSRQPLCVAVNLLRAGTALAFHSRHPTEESTTGELDLNQAQPGSTMTAQ